MGALTLKSFPFELRGWDIEKFESLDPTDSFGSNTKVYISKDQVVLIEPDYNIHTFNTWLTDKGRQFFDGIFNTWNKKTKESELNFKKDFWLEIFKMILKSAYILDQCNTQKINKKFFTIVFENVSLEVLNLLLILSQNYSFIRLKRAENVKLVNTNESTFQLNTASDKIKLSHSTLCLLISMNPRYEGYYLNLNLRQRFLKGNFKCLSLGSLIDLSFPVSFLGTNVSLLKSIAEGNSLLCQDFKFAKNPIIIYNSELFKRKDQAGILQILTYLNQHSTFNTKYWNGLNMLSSSLSETGNHFLNKIPALTSKDLINTSSLYLINVSANNSSSLKKVVELKLLISSYSGLNKNTNIFDQNFKINQNFDFSSDLFDSSLQYYSLPTSIFYENEETFINTEGFFKRTVKLVSRKKTRNNWQILRKLLKHLKLGLSSLNEKNNEILFFNSNRLVNFKNFVNFHFYAIRSLNNLNFYLTIKTKPVYFFSKHNNFKLTSNKTQNTKLKYWLDDFYTGGKDEYSQNSLVLINCSRILRAESTNFF